MLRLKVEVQLHCLRTSDMVMRGANCGKTQAFGFLCWVQHKRTSGRQQPGIHSSFSILHSYVHQGNWIWHNDNEQDC